MTTKYNRKQSKSIVTPTERLYESKAGEIIKQIEERISEGTFRLRWDAAPCNFLTKHKYTNMNLLLIAFSQMFSDKQFQSKYWLTLGQANKLGYRILKDSSATYIVQYFRGTYDKEELDENGQKVIVKKQGSLVSKSLAIYNLEQTTAQVETEHSTVKSSSFEETLTLLKNIMSETEVTFEQGGNSAHYKPLRHSIKMPFFQHFIGETQELREQLYLTTLCHELAHSTMKFLRPEHYHPMINVNPYESISEALYAKEEVVAEITAAMLCATLGVEKQVLPDHFGYIRGWLDAAKKESPLYFTTACKLATEAHDFLMSKVDSSFVLSLKEHTETT